MEAAITFMVVITPLCYSPGGMYILIGFSVKTLAGRQIFHQVPFLSGRFFALNRDFESILEEILLGRGQGNLKLKPKQKEALQRSRLFKNCRSNCRITETSA